MDELKQLLKSYIEAAHPLLVQQYNDRPSFRPEAIITHGENGSISTRFEARPDYAEILFGLRETLPQLSELNALLEYVKTNNTLANDLLVDAAGVRLPTDDTGPFFSFTVWPFLASYLQDLTSLSQLIDEAVFESIFADLKTYLESTQIALIYEAPIIGLKADFDRLDFSDDVWIRLRTDEDIKRVSKPYITFDLIQNEVSFNAYFLVVRTYVDKHSPMGTEAAGKIAENVMSAFRLCKSGQISLGSSRQYSQLRVGERLGVLQSPASGLRSGDYTLESEEVDTVKALMSSCSTNEDTRWQLALRRLNLTYDRKLNEDRLIDCWIGLETLLLPDGNEGELRYKVSLRLSRFLGETKNKRLSLKKETKTSYDRRSDIVHGKTPLKEDVPQVTDKTAELLRKVLVQWLDSEHSHTVEDIDNSLLA